MVEEDVEAMQQELKEAFRLYDKEGEIKKCHKLYNFLPICPMAILFFLPVVKYCNICVHE